MNSLVEILPLVPALVIGASMAAGCAVAMGLRGIGTELRALSGDLASAQGRPMMIRMTVRPTGAAASPVALYPFAAADAEGFTPDRCPADGRAAA